jgi:DNA-binding transcriptional ArsR family regulator
VKDTHLLRTLEEVRALSDPLRLRIMDCLRDGPLTVGQVAQRLGEKTTKLYYHFADLEKQGLIEAVETRQRGNLLEKYYLPVAKYFQVDSAIYQSGPEALGEFFKGVRQMLDRTAQNLKQAIDAQRFTENETADAILTFRKGRMTATEVSEFRERLGALIREFSERDRGPDATIPIALAVVFHTTTPEPPDDASAENAQDA